MLTDEQKNADRLLALINRNGVNGRMTEWFKIFEWRMPQE